MEKKNLIYLSLLVLIIIVIGAFYLLTKNQYVPDENLKESETGKKSVIVESETLTLKPGESKILSEDMRIRFGSSGTEFSVPDIIFGEDYNLNNPQDINYLPIYNTIELYDNGKIISLQKQQCETEDVLSDVLERHIVDCKIRINIEDSVEPKISETTVIKIIRGSDSTRPIYRPNYAMTIQGERVNENPLLYIGIPEFSFSGRSSSEDYKLGFTIITNFGIAEIIYIPIELFDEVTKNIQIGPAIIAITPQKNVVRSKNTNEDFSFQISINFEDDAENYPVNIINFTY